MPPVILTSHCAQRFFLQLFLDDDYVIIIPLAKIAIRTRILLFQRNFSKPP